MSATHVHPKWVLWWAQWGAQAFMSLATLNVWWMRAVWVQFSVAEGWAATHKSKVRMPDGEVVEVGDTLSETSTWVSLFSKPASKWWQGWKGAVSLFEIPLLCIHFWVTMAMGPEGLRPGPILIALIVPAVGLYLWLIYHFLNVVKHG